MIEALRILQPTEHKRLSLADLWGQSPVCPSECQRRCGGSSSLGWHVAPASPHMRTGRNYHKASQIDQCSARGEQLHGEKRNRGEVKKVKIYDLVFTRGQSGFYLETNMEIRREKGAHLTCSDAVCSSAHIVEIGAKHLVYSKQCQQLWKSDHITPQLRQKTGLCNSPTL